ncbi:hypothetical protein [Roseivivax lentus]|uniref:hypothetical protein n=1 Tax=Roseivivax lentus TaxID=633194 RepID=UPI00117BA23F|nr:hypothetical protein [Roseivivax lentus]
MTKSVMKRACCAAFIGSASIATTASAEDRNLASAERGHMTVNTYSWSSSQSGTYAQQGTWEEQIRRDTEQGFSTYLGAMRSVATISGQAPVNDVVPGTGRARKGISKDVNQKVDKISDMYDGYTR